LTGQSIFGGVTIDSGIKKGILNISLIANDENSDRQIQYGKNQFQWWAILRKSALSLLLLLLLLTVIGACVVQIRVLRQVQEGFESAHQPPVNMSEPEFPDIDRLMNPHAILVLDVSGSMQSSDPKHLQSEAVRQFFDIYRELSKEIVGKAEEAKLAIVLFSTIAQVIDWTGNGEAWLPITETNRTQLETVIDTHLGRVGDKDPRRGRDTDYLAALEEIDRLIREKNDGNTPPAVVFMTDGLYDPHPFFSPLLPLDQRTEAVKGKDTPAINQLFEQRQNTIQSVVDGHYRFLSARANPVKPVFDTRPLNVEGLVFNQATLASYPAAVALAHERLLSRRFWLSSSHPSVTLLWSAVFLGGQNPETVDKARELLTSTVTSGPWAGHEGFIRCSEASDLTAEFVHVLADWFRLRKLQLAVGHKEIQIPQETQAFATVLTTDRDVNSCTLRSGRKTVQLNGNGRVWAGVIRGGGHWSLDAEIGKAKSWNVFLRPRYEWVLHAANILPFTSSGDAVLPTQLLLYSLESGSPAMAEEVFGDLPAELPLSISFLHRPTILTRLERSTGVSAYRANVPLSGLVSDTALLKADLAPLELANILGGSGMLEFKVSLRPKVRVLLTDSQGRETAIHLKGVPRETDTLKKKLEDLGVSLAQ